jgi:glutamate 5-kinase
MRNNLNHFFSQAQRVVVKVGTGVLTNDDGCLDVDKIKSLSFEISQLIDKEKEIILVSSGAMAAGVKKIGLSKRPNNIPGRQASCAVGQAALIMEYERSFGKYEKKVAQILLTSDDLYNRKRYLNARNTIYTLLSWNITPVINENDTVVVEEIKFGDNDNLSAMIALLMDADILINLTDIEGLYTKDPKKNPDAKFIPIVTSYKKNIEKAASNIPGALGTGGMLSKVKAAKKITSAGIPMVIANGKKNNNLTKLFMHEPVGTFFVPKNKRISNRKCWIGFSLKPKGTIIIDHGAANAILNKGKSLLSIGIIDIFGKFNVGAPVNFKTKDGATIGIGLVNYKSDDIRKIIGYKTDMIENILGYKSYDEVIHRDNFSIIGECK